MLVYRCENGHVAQVNGFGRHYDELPCEECGSETWTRVTDVAELKALADNHSPMHDIEAVHRFSDAAMLARMEQLDPELAEWYKAHWEKGFWYA